MKLNWNFVGEKGGGGGCKTENLLWEEYEYFLELHNIYAEIKVHLTPKGFFLLNKSLHLFETYCAI